MRSLGCWLILLTLFQASSALACDYGNRVESVPVIIEAIAIHTEPLEQDEPRRSLLGWAQWRSLSLSKRWRPDTRTQFLVQESYKGDIEGVVEAFHRAGLGETPCDGVVQFNLGERYLLFLEYSPDGSLILNHFANAVETSDIEVILTHEVRPYLDRQSPRAPALPPRSRPN